MQGLILSSKLPGPRNTEIRSYTTALVVALGTTRIINFHNEFKGLARAVSFLNRDGTNSATITINNDRINQITIAPNSVFNLNDQWIEQVEVLAGGAGATNVMMEIVPIAQIL